MTQKGILFSGGPLDGQQLMVPDDAIKEYKFARLKKPLSESGIIDKEDCFYYKTEYKIRDCEIFVWQDDYIPPPPEPLDIEKAISKIKSATSPSP